MLFPAIGFPKTSDTGGFFIGKKEIHAAGEYFAPTTTDVYAPTHAPQLQFAPVTSYGYQGATTIISSPGAVSKKEQVMEVVSKPKMRGEWDLPIDVAQAPEHTKDISGTNMTHIALIAVVGAAAIMLIKKKI